KESGDYFLLNADSLNSGLRSGRVGNNKSVKSVFSSGHFELLLLPARSKSGRRSTTKGTNSPKAICANFGTILFVTYLKICSGWIGNLKVFPRRNPSGRCLQEP